MFVKEVKYNTFLLYLLAIVYILVKNLMHFYDTGNLDDI